MPKKKAEPGVADSVLGCVYCHTTGDRQHTLHTFLPCGHIICRACHEGATSHRVRVISPHGLTPLPSAADHKDEAGQCEFCSAALRTPSEVAPSTLDLLRCVLCRGVCQNACESVCGHSMCEPCAQYLCRTTGVCPACRQPLRGEDIVPGRMVRRRVHDLEFVCKYEVYGCGESGKVEGLCQHESQCEFGERACHGCGRCLKRNELEHHVAKCAAIQLDCPFQCGARLCRSDMAMHVSVCDYGVVVCDLPACDHHTQRRHLAQHQADSAFHLRLLYGSFQQTQHQQRHDLDQHQKLIRQLQASHQQQQQSTKQQYQNIKQQQQHIETQQLDDTEQIYQTIQQLQLSIQQSIQQSIQEQQQVTKQQQQSVQRQQLSITQQQHTIQQQQVDLNGVQARSRHLQQQVEQLQQLYADLRQQQVAHQQQQMQHNQQLQQRVDTLQQKQSDLHVQFIFASVCLFVLCLLF